MYAKSCLSSKTSTTAFLVSEGWVMGIGGGSGGAVAGLGVLACCVWGALSLFVVWGKVGVKWDASFWVVY